MNRKDELIDEMLFPYEGISKEERDFCLDILRNCKDICDTDNNLGEHRKCNIVTVSFKRKDNFIAANGELILGDDEKKEFRSIEVLFSMYKDKVVTNMVVTRWTDPQETYRVIETFMYKDGVLSRKSVYEQKGFTHTVIEDEKVKGRFK